LQQQTQHSDHRRFVEKGVYRDDDFTKLNQEHKTWASLPEWIEACENLVAVPPPSGSQSPSSFLIATLEDTVICIPPHGKPDAEIEKAKICVGRACGFKGYTKHAGGHNKKANRRPHAYSNVKDLRYLPISRPESLWALLAAQDRSDSDAIGVPFDANYKAVLGIRALGHLEVYEFEEEQ
jgi:hypothetical protein